ncbi:hypothetical protein CANCADRAFT_84042 [Tortispora caseinolytica NRRL Y-17796]|uniref:Uncharacterized protein n=1 Tax=Tortispora caseinolytica NRRL Y-17796 TaxID=767744 RepID=A0A1E4TKD7_9ASCO|nr:hypothetical protein CANCADRAFT_84042 [Tortispora caseinolytica NRRL Y-17796]
MRISCDIRRCSSSRLPFCPNMFFPFASNIIVEALHLQVEIHVLRQAAPRLLKLITAPVSLRPIVKHWPAVDQDKHPTEYHTNFGRVFDMPLPPFLNFHSLFFPFLTLIFPPHLIPSLSRPFSFSMRTS